MAVGIDVLTQGPPRYGSQSSWSALSALAATGVVALAPGIFLVAVLAVLRPVLGDQDDGGQSFLSLATLQGVTFAATIQLLSLVLVWSFAGYGGQRADVLSLTAERFTAGLYAVAALMLLSITGLLEFLLYRTFALDIFADTGWLVEGLQGPTAIGVFVIAVILAPLWEELTFRGFLLSALANTRLGYWGAALVSNALWSGLHANYSWAGLASVFVAGLILSWLVWRTGSIKPAIITHAFGNLAALVFTYMFAPVPAPMPV